MTLTDSAVFKRKATRSLLSILFFILVYLILVLFAVGLTAACVVGGITIIVAKPMLLTIGLGGGIIGMGVFVLIFLFKFLFKKNVTDRSGMLEIFEQDQPELFKLIRNLSKEIKTDFPKRIYLTPEVNAAVFYDSSFWSMFLPVRKNLMIGLGLVNSVTESELKAILAHEFGHFSQKTMKLGSYVYNVNQIIHNLLYDNDSYEQMMKGWAEISGFFAFFTSISVKIVQGIQWILRKTYSLVNISYMDLSREMEFQADAIAASVAGSQPLIDSLLRFNIADAAYQNVIGFYNSGLNSGYNTGNIYPQHSFVLEQLAEVHKMKLDKGLPVVSEDEVKTFNRSSLVIKDQWASHPDTLERIDRLKELKVDVPLSSETAWKYFRGKEKVQEKMTRHLFSTVTYSVPVVEFELSAFCDSYRMEVEKFSFNKEYKDFYDNRDISAFDLDKALQDIFLTEADSTDKIFDESSVALVNDYNALTGDMQTLKQIRDGLLPVKTFDYDGEKFKLKNIQELIDRLVKQKEILESKLTDIDRKAFCLFYKAAEQKSLTSTLKDKYIRHFQILEESKNDLNAYVEMCNSTEFLSQETAFNMIAVKVNILKQKETIFKKRLSRLCSEVDVKDFLDKDQIERINFFLSQDLTYFKDSNYNESALELLFAAIQFYMPIALRRVFDDKKALLAYQIDLIKDSENIQVGAV